MPRLQRPSHLVSLLACVLIVGCGGVGDPGPHGSPTLGATSTSSTPLPPQGPIQPGLTFQAVSTTVFQGATWQLNREIDIAFNRDVDFATVSSSTIPIVDGQGVPAVGSFTAVTPRVVRFQPQCPTDEENSNGGFGQGLIYRLSVLSETTPGAGGGVTVMSTAGERLVIGLDVPFRTPLSSDPAILFVDTVAGPPLVRVRGLSGEPAGSDQASFVEFGSGAIEYFEFNPMTSTDPVGEIASLVPLNLYSRPEERFSIVLRFDQSISCASTSRSRRRARTSTRS